MSLTVPTPPAGAHRTDIGISVSTCSYPFFVVGRYEDAERFLRLDRGSDWASWVTSVIQMRQGNAAAALASIERISDDDFAKTLFVACLDGSAAETVAALSPAVESIFTAARDGEMHYWNAGPLAYCGQEEAAIRLLRRGIAQGYCSYPHLDEDPILAPLADHPEMAGLRETAIACREELRAAVGEPGG